MPRRASYVISTVEAPSSSYDLTSLETVKTVLQITDGASDSYLDLLITQASAAAASFCNRVFASEKLQDVFRLQRGTNGLPSRIDELQLSRWPVTAIASVTTLASSNDTAATLVEGTDFETDYDLGQLFRLGGDGNPCRWDAIKTTVVYTAGYKLPGNAGASLPGDIEGAVIDLVKLGWFGRARDPLLRSDEVAGVGTQQFWIGSTSGNQGSLPPSVADRLVNYRVPTI